MNSQPNASDSDKDVGDEIEDDATEDAENPSGHSEEGDWNSESDGYSDSSEEPVRGPIYAVPKRPVPTPSKSKHKASKRNLHSTPLESFKQNSDQHSEIEADPDSDLGSDLNSDPDLDYISDPVSSSDPDSDSDSDKNGEGNPAAENRSRRKGVFFRGKWVPQPPTPNYNLPRVTRVEPPPARKARRVPNPDILLKPQYREIKRPYVRLRRNRETMLNYLRARKEINRIKHRGGTSGVFGACAGVLRPGSHESYKYGKSPYSADDILATHPRYLKLKEETGLRIPEGPPPEGLPSSMLLEQLHKYVSAWCEKNDPMMLRSMDESALLALGVCVEEAIGKMLGKEGHEAYARFK